MHQPISELKRLPMRELLEYAAEIREMVEAEEEKFGALLGG